MASVPAWRIAGDWFDVCRCRVPCFCTFAQAPDEDQCDGILAWLGAGDDLAEFVTHAKKPTVDFSFRRPHLNFPRVLEDHTHAAGLVAEHFLSRGFKNFMLTLGVKNLLDTDPPATNQQNTFQVGYDPSYYDARARFVYGSIRYSFK